MTNTPPIMTDQPAQFLRRNRATTLDPSAMFLRELASDEAQDRLSMVNRTFKNVAVVTPFPDLWENRLQNAHFVRPADNLGLEPQTFDLVIHDLCLHWANDPVGQLVQSRLALQPDGFFWQPFLAAKRCTSCEPRWPLPKAEQAVAFHPAWRLWLKFATWADYCNARALRCRWPMRSLKPQHTKI